MYHRVAPLPAGTKVPGHYVHPARFRSHVRFLAGLGFEAVSLAAMHAGLRGEGSLPRRPVVFTFDDGYRNFATVAAPALEAAGWRGTVFVVPGLFGATNEWDHRNGDVVEPLLGAAEARALADQGHELGSHTWSHARLTEVGRDAALRELVQAKDALEQALGRPVPYFCYPYGAHDDAVCRLVREVGHAGACTVLRGKNDPGTNPFRWRRINVRRDTSTPILAWKLLRRSKSGR
jgi:peptidoglycan/xylan/chitin deacetylase (PgdA/CDA1 family)